VADRAPRAKRIEERNAVILLRFVRIVHRVSECGEIRVIAQIKVLEMGSIFIDLPAMDESKHS